MKNKLALISLLIFGLFLGNSFSQPDEDFFHGKKFAMPMIEKLNLSDKQKDELTKLRTEHQKQMIDLRSELKKLLLDVKNAWLEKDLDKKKIETLTDKIASIRNKMAKARLNHWFDIYSKLDEEQKITFRKFSGKMLEKFSKQAKEFREEFRHKFRGPKPFKRPMPPVER